MIAAIEAAFPDAPAPPFDPRLDQLVPEDTVWFRRRRWRSIVSERLPHDAPYFFGDDSFRYYLPAYLIAAIRWPRRAAKGNLRPSVIFCLVPPRRSHPDRPAFLERMNGFSGDQRAAIRAALEYFDATAPGDDNAGRALRGYWARL